MSLKIWQLAAIVITTAFVTAVLTVFLERDTSQLGLCVVGPTEGSQPVVQVVLETRTVNGVIQCDAGRFVSVRPD